MESQGSRTPDPGVGEDRGEFIRDALERFEAPLVNYALGLTGDLEAARDAVQDTFLRLCEQPPGKVDSHLAQWLFTVCRNRILDVRRKDQRMTPLHEVELDHRVAPDPSPADQAVARDGVRHITELLADLPPHQREVVRLKFQNQLSYQEIAAITSLTVSHVGVLLHTALKTLREWYQSKYQGDWLQKVDAAIAECETERAP